jgi:hypothetical protein
MFAPKAADLDHADHRSVRVWVEFLRSQGALYGTRAPAG